MTSCLSVSLREVATSSAATMAIEMLQQHLCFLYAEARAARPRDMDPPADELQKLIDKAHLVLRSAIEALDVVDLLHETGLFDERFDVAPQGTLGNEVLDVTGISWLNLKNRQSEIELLNPRSTLVERIATVDGAMHAVQKSLGTLERVLASIEARPPGTDFYKENIETSLALRRQYATFHETVVDRSEPTPDELPKWFRTVGNGIANLLGRSFMHIRAPDRAILLLCQSRIRDFLVRPQEDGWLLAGQRLRQDIVAAATMILDINKREEIVLHDIQLVERALAHLALPNIDPSGGVCHLVTELQAMRGRSRELDALLAGHGIEVSRDQLHDALQACARVLGCSNDAQANEDSDVSGFLGQITFNEISL